MNTQTSQRLRQTKHIGCLCDAYVVVEDLLARIESENAG